MELKGKTIFIISYENWGPMLMSKHHYAIELARAGNKVYFINHPDRRKTLKRGEIKISDVQPERIHVVHHRLILPYFLKFRFNALFNFFTRIHINKIIKKTGQYPDVVWSFDTGNTLPLKYFIKSKWRILMPVDGPYGHKDEIRSAKKADVIISVTARILNVFSNVNVPKLLVNHGVANVFLEQIDCKPVDDRIRVGYSGSLIRNDLDTDTFLKIIDRYDDIIFEFWGEHNFKKSNIHLPQDVHNNTLNFIETLKAKKNVVLHGPVSSEHLAAGLVRMSILLICYNIKNDQNHHKVLEYLGTGKVIVSNYMSSYAEEDPDLVYMDRSEDGRSELAGIFDAVVSQLSSFNSAEKQRKRKDFAKKFSYANNVRRIDEFLAANDKDKLHQQS